MIEQTKNTKRQKTIKWKYFFKYATYTVFFLSFRLCNFQIFLFLNKQNRKNSSYKNNSGSNVQQQFVAKKHGEEISKHTKETGNNLHPYVARSADFTFGSQVGNDRTGRIEGYVYG